MGDIVLNCLFVALVWGGPNAAEWEYKDADARPEICIFMAQVDKSTGFIRLRQVEPTTPGQVGGGRTLEAEIELPKEVGWKALHYKWGSQYAYIQGRRIAVRMGPLAVY